MVTKHTVKDYRNPRKIAEESLNIIKKTGSLRIHGDNLHKISLVGHIMTMELRKDDMDVVFHINMYRDDRNKQIFEYIGYLTPQRIKGNPFTEKTKEVIV